MAASTIGFFFLRPFCVSITRCHSKIPRIGRPLFTSLSSFSSLTSPESASLSIIKSFINDDNSHSLSLLARELEEQEDEFEQYDSDGADTSEVGSAEDSILKVGDELEMRKAKLPNLTVKEKKELASYAHSLGEKLKCQLVGKSGVTANVVSSFIETLEANELLKIKIHRTCPGEMEDVVKQLEEATGSVVVGQIGRTVIIYRPSVTKMKAEEKKKQRRVFRRIEKSAFQKKGQVARSSGRGRRGSS